MEKYAADIKAGIVGVLGFFTALWGWFGWLLILFVAVMVVDYITGSRVAAKKGEWNSEAAWSGRFKKLMTLVVIGVAGVVDYVLGYVINNIPQIELPFTYSVLICPVVVLWYLFTELGSILENAVTAGANVPAPLQKLVKGLKVSAGDLMGKAAGGGKEDSENGQSSEN